MSAGRRGSGVSVVRYGWRAAARAVRRRAGLYVSSRFSRSRPATDTPGNSCRWQRWVNHRAMLGHVSGAASAGANPLLTPLGPPAVRGPLIMRLLGHTADMNINCQHVWSIGCGGGFYRVSKTPSYSIANFKQGLVQGVEACWPHAIIARLALRHTFRGVNGRIKGAL